MKETIKYVFFLMLCISRFYVLWRFLNKKTLVVLTVHGVMDEDEGGQWTPTRPQTSRKQLQESIRLISKYFEIISLTEATRMLSGAIPFRNNCVTISFDDGYRNTLTHAGPILKKYGVPSTLFVSTGHVERRQCFWFDKIDFAVQALAASGGKSLMVRDQSFPVDNSSPAKLKKSIKNIIFGIKNISGDDGEAMSAANDAIATVEKQTGRRLDDIVETDYWCGIVSWTDLKQAHNSGITVGSHTVDHARLGLLGEEDAFWQLTESKRMIEKNIGKSCEYLCFPNGSYSQQTLLLARKAGYTAALTTKEGLNRPGDDIMEIKRLHLPQGRTAVESLAVASGLIYRLSQLKSRILNGSKLHEA